MSMDLATTNKEALASAKNAQTLESLIENLDHRGVLVLQVLLGQQCIKLLSEDKVKKVLKDVSGNN